MGMTFLSGYYVESQKEELKNSKIIDDVVRLSKKRNGKIDIQEALIFFFEKKKEAKEFIPQIQPS